MSYEFMNRITDYIFSGHAILHVSTHERDRALQQIVNVSKEIDRPVYVWSTASGWKDADGNEAKPCQNPDQALEQIIEISGETGGIFVLKEFGFYMQHSTYPECDRVIAWLDDIKEILSVVGATVIILGTDFQIPEAMKHDITEIDFNLPDESQIELCINKSCEDVHYEDGSKLEVSQQFMPEIVNACRGMTQQQIIDRVCLAIRRHKDLDASAVKTLLREKANVIKSSGLLKYVEPPEGGLDTIGGYEVLKKHIRLDKPCFTNEAREFGIEFPKGIMMVGIPGCGKTILSLAIASELGLPLISFDVGCVMDSLVGESERNMREVIKLLESIAPCVLQIDEVEKAFGGAGSIDGGTSRRVFRNFLMWLNDRTCPVYVVATANEIESLPPEFSRKGRFDEIFGLDLPMEHERQEIFKIHINKRGRDSNNFDTTGLAKATEGFTGADIEESVKMGLKIAFSSGEELNDNHISVATQTIVPLSRAEPDKIETIQKWVETRAKKANPRETRRGNRRVTVKS